MLKIEKLDTPEITAGKVRDEWIYYESIGADHRYQMAEDYDFYLGNQLTDEQKDYLIAVGQPPEANNKIRPAVEQVLANIAASSPEWQTTPVGKTDHEVSFVFSQLMADIWDKSYGDIQFRRNCKDFIVKGLTYDFVYPDWQAEGGLGALRIRKLPPESVFVDPNSALPDFSDASSIIYSDLHTKESLKIALPQFADRIEEADEDFDKNELATGKYSRDSVTTAGDIMDNRQPMVRKFIRFAKVSVPLVRITDIATGNTKLLTKEMYKDAWEDERYRMFVELGLFIETIVYETHIRETFCVGDILIYDDILPITQYPIIPACNEHTGTPYPSGDVRHSKSPQRMLNRTEALIIAHTSAQSGNKFYYEDGAIEPDELLKINIPNAPVKLNPGAITGGKTHWGTPNQPSSELYHEKARYERDIETIFGAYKFQQGDPAGAPGTVGEAQIIDEASARKQNWKILPIYDMLTQAARVALEWVPYVYDQQRVLRMVNPVGDEKEVILNQVVEDHTGAVKRIYDMVSSRVDIKVVIGSTRAKSPMANLQKDLALLSANIYDRTEVIMNLPGDVNKVALLQRLGEIEQLKALLSEYEKKIKRLEGDAQTKDREIFHANMRAEIAEATKPVAKAISNLQAQTKLEGARQRDKTRQTAEDLGAVLKTVNSRTRAPSEIAEG